jgi:dolichyl-phosphate beta-glucosyltransferase
MIIKNLSVIFPFFNESLRVDNCFKNIKDFNQKNKRLNCEYIFVDDGSKDNTSKKIIKFIKSQKKNSYKKFKLIKLKKNCGKGAALKKGVNKSKNNWILTSDIDISVSLNQLNIWFKKKKSFDYNKIYFGSRNLLKSKVAYKIHRKIIGFFFNIIMKFLLGINLKDTQCGFKLYPKKIAKKIFSQIKIEGFAHDVEIVLLAKKFNFDIKELPVKWVHKNNGKINLIKDSLKMFASMIKLKRKFN